MRKFILSAILGFVLASSHPALGFDGFRQGFVLGLGAGLGGVHNDLAIGTEKKFAGMIDSLIGYGISNKFAIHYTHKSFWYDSDGELMASAISRDWVHIFYDREGACHLHNRRHR
ncbi:MAG: hypothetical protein WBC20_00090 [Candidatus Aminicenantaceae bacterium]